MDLLASKQGFLLVMSENESNNLYFPSIYLLMKFFCWVILVILMPAKVFLALLYFLPDFPQNTFSSNILLAVGNHFLFFGIFHNLC